MNKYINAWKKGSEIVIVSNDIYSNSYIFYMDIETGVIYTFSRFFGLFPRTDITLETIAEHCLNSEKDCKVFIRGYDD